MIYIEKPIPLTNSARNIIKEEIKKFTKLLVVIEIGKISLGK